MQNRPASFTKKFISGEMYFGFWGMISKVLGLGNTFLTVSSLTVYQYGVLQLILATYAAFADLMLIGSPVVSNEIFRLVGSGKEEKAKRLFFEYNKLYVLIAIFFWGLFFFGAPVLSFRYGPDFIQFAKIISFLFLFEVFLAAAKLLLKLRLKFKVVASRSSIAKFVQFSILSYFFFFSHLGLREVLLSLVIAMFISLLSLVPAAIKAYRPWVGRAALNERILLGIFFAHGKWDILRSLFSRLTSRIEPWILKLFVGTEAVAIFSVANTIVGTIKDYFPNNTINSLAALAVEDKARSQRIFSYGMKYMFLLSIAVSIAALIAVPPFIRLFFAKYSASLPLFYILLFNLPMGMLAFMPSIYLQILKKQKFLLYQGVIRSIIEIPLVLILVILFGLWGLVAKEILIKLIMFPITLWYFLRYQNLVSIKWGELFSFTGNDRIFLANMYSNFTSLIKMKLNIK
ncbi:MAG: oligosaccharide flippase family protein [Candidatus Harrisonbacteria bacterium]|nr:oligosaccharide flippase family protein [Candidatus Harrisonbacteria bacterium]